MKVFTVIAVCFFFASPVIASEKPNIGRQIESAKSSPTLKVWMSKERERLSPQNLGYQIDGPKGLCEVMNSVGFGCSYNERDNIVTYLYVNSVDLFPCEAGTNPYTRDECGKMDSDNRGDSFFNFVGNTVQNAILEKSIQKNRRLFKNGNLTAAAASKWKK